MVFLPKPINQFGDLTREGFTRPGRESAPVIFGLLPQDLDHVEFRAVGRQIQGDEAVLDHPALQDCGLDVQVNGGVVHDDESELRAVAGHCNTLWAPTEF